MPSKKSSGFTLIETVYAVFLTSAAAAILVASMPTATMAYSAANGQQKAMNLAQKEIESIRTLGYSNANPTQLFANGLVDSTVEVADNTCTFTNTDSANSDSVAQVLPNGTGAVEIDQINLNLCRVVVTVNWTDQGRNQSFQLATLLANL